MSGLDSLYQQLILEHSKTRSGGDLADRPAIAAGTAPVGVFLCGSGIGICISANKVDGIRAAQVYDEFSAEMSRRHNDANVICLGARTLPDDRIAKLVDLFLATPFEGGRHATRVEKIGQIERDESSRRA